MARHPAARTPTHAPNGGAVNPISINRATGEIQVQLGPTMAEPVDSFYADYLLLVEIAYGMRLLAVVAHPQRPSVAMAAVQLVFDEPSFPGFIGSLRGIKAALEFSAPTGVSAPPDLQLPEQIPSFRVTAAYVATSTNGITLDFYHLPPLEIQRVASKIYDVSLRPVLRVETLPGRLHDLVAAAERMK